MQLLVQFRTMTPKFEEGHQQIQGTAKLLQYIFISETDQKFLVSLTEEGPDPRNEPRTCLLLLGSANRSTIVPYNARLKIQI